MIEEKITKVYMFRRNIFRVDVRCYIGHKRIDGLTRKRTISGKLTSKGIEIIFKEKLCRCNQ